MDIKEIIIKKGIIKKKKGEGGRKGRWGENHSFIFRETMCNSEGILKI